MFVACPRRRGCWTNGYRERYSALSDTTLPQRRPPYVGIPFNQAKAEGRPRIGFRRQMVADGGRWWDFAQIPAAERLRAGAALPVLSSSASAGRTGGLGAHRRPHFGLGGILLVLLVIWLVGGFGGQGAALG